MSDKRQMSTRLYLKNGERYPVIWIKWTEDDDCHGWTGKLALWPTKDSSDGKEHCINLRQSMPLGLITVMFDEVGGAGCWELTQIDGTGITERDLQWATSWAALAKKTKDKAMEQLNG